jgi:transposase
MWTNQNRARYDRSKLRYPSDLTDDEWGLVEPLIRPGKTGGGKRTVIMREVVNGLMYILSTGCQWRAALAFKEAPQLPRHWRKHLLDKRSGVVVHICAQMEEMEAEQSNILFLIRKGTEQE